MIVTQGDPPRVNIPRCFPPRVLLVALFLSMAIFPLVEQEAGTAADPLTPEERAFVATHGPIRYAPDPLFPPFEFLDPSGIARGMTPDLLMIMGKKLGVEFRTVAYPTWSDVLDAVKGGKVDLLGTLTRTPEREGFLLFSSPYLSVPYVLFVRQGGRDPETIEDMVLLRLGVVRNYGINTWLSTEHPKIHPLAVEDTATGLTMVATGQLDALLETLPVGAQIVREKSLTNIRIVPRHIYTLPQHFGVRKGEPLLFSIVQKGLDSLTETERSEVFVRWTGQDFSRPPPAIPPFLRNVLLVLVSAAVLSWVWIAALRRSVRRATQSLRESEERFRNIFRENSSVMLLIDPDSGRIEDANPAAAAFYGYPEDMLRTMTTGQINALPEMEVAAERAQALYKKQDHFIFPHRLANGEIRTVEVHSSPVKAGGRFLLFSIIRDITERKRAEENLKQTIRLNQILLDAFPCVALLLRPRTREIVASNAAGVKTGAVPGACCYSTWGQREVPCPWCLAPAVWETGKEQHLELEADGIFWDAHWIPVSEDLYMHFAFDVTDRKHAGAEKEKLQAQLQQAMKMEAVGRLAGGVAHDFNNLLTVITGYSELLLQKVEKESPLHGAVEEIKRAGERAALLTQQLLAFSRKQIIEPKVVCLNLLVAEMQAMLPRLIGENIALQSTTGKNLGSVKIDPGQFQQILMNLVVNARDAMPDGGKIVIETANADLDEGYCDLHPYVKPGRFVMLSVSDTGMGMSEEIKTHIFEPFFTTKERGKGTGLGLAMTYGAVKQSGGSIEAYSEVGIGTTIRIYLPRVEEEAVKSEKDDRPTDLPGGTETILVVEDEDSVRDLCVQILKRLGYKVLQAPNGAEAIAVAQGYVERIDLLLTDVVMPGMNGRELATQLVPHHPEIKVLFTSGYTDNVIVRHGVLDKGVSFIGKPYTPLALARKVRKVLDEA